MMSISPTEVGSKVGSSCDATYTASVGLTPISSASVRMYARIEGAVLRLVIESISVGFPIDAPVAAGTASRKQQSAIT